MQPLGVSLYMSSIVFGQAMGVEVYAGWGSGCVVWGELGLA